MKKIQRMKKLKSDVGYIRMIETAQKKHKVIR
jgi:hypothetical protein